VSGQLHAPAALSHDAHWIRGWKKEKEAQKKEEADKDK
jgi:hypothetical protein